ncbi:hypothetical protein ACFL02_05380 [Planctomycetota bacterium]
MDKKAILQEAIRARNANQKIIDSLGGEPGKPRPRTKLEQVEALGLDPKVYALTYIVEHPELTLAQAAMNLQIGERTVYRWRGQALEIARKMAERVADQKRK